MNSDPVQDGNMRLHLSDDIDIPGLAKTNAADVSATVGTLYYLDCVAYQAIPPPTVTATNTGTALSASASSPAFPDMESGALNTRVTTLRYTFTAAVGDHCKTLTCTAVNDANTLIYSYLSSHADAGDQELTARIILTGGECTIFPMLYL